MEKQKIRSFGDLFKDSWQLYTKYFWKFIGILAIPFIPLLVVLLLSNILTPLFSGSDIALGVINIIIGLLGILATIFMIIVFWISYAAVFKLIDKPVKKIKLKEFLLLAKKMAWPLFIVILVSQAITTFWTLLFIIPGIIFSMFYLLSPWVFFKEGFTGVTALKRSKELVAGYWWPVFGRYLLLVLIILAIFMIPSFFIAADTTAELVYDLISNVVSIIIMPFSLSFIYFIYKDLYKIKGKTKLKNKVAKLKTAVAIVIYIILVIITALVWVAVREFKTEQEQQNTLIQEAIDDMDREEIIEYLETLEST